MRSRAARRRQRRKSVRRGRDQLLGADSGSEQPDSEAEETDAASIGDAATSPAPAAPRCLVCIASAARAWDAAYSFSVDLKQRCRRLGLPVYWLAVVLCDFGPALQATGACMCTGWPSPFVFGTMVQATGACVCTWLWGQPEPASWPTDELKPGDTAAQS